jgi:hypothetical protein
LPKPCLDNFLAGFFISKATEVSGLQQVEFAEVQVEPSNEDFRTVADL